jgi:hypothetical protein
MAMAPRVRALVILLFLVLAGPVRAQTKEPAELLPAQTLAYVEVRQPERLSREITGLLRGSALEDLPATMSKFRSRQGDREMYFYGDGLNVYGLILSPEFLSEAGRLRGAAVALTGVGKEGPEYVALLQTGASNVPGLYMRAYLVSNSAVRIRGTIEGVTLYGERHRIWKKKSDPFPRPAPDQPPPYQESTTTYATLPGMVLIGTEGAVKEVIRRAKGKTAEPSLARLRAYQESAQLRASPGLFGYADLDALQSQMAALGGDDRGWARLKKALKTQAFKSLTASLSLVGGELSLQARLHLDPKHSSPLLDLLPSVKADPGLLHFAPPGSTLALSVRLTDGADRWAKVLSLVEALDQAPPREIKKLEQKSGLSLGKDVFGKVSSLGLVVASWEREYSPMFVVSGTDAEAAQFLEQTAVPKLIAMVSGLGEAPAIRKETVFGQTILSVPGLPLRYGRQGRTLVIGQDARAVAESLAAGKASQGMPANRQVAESLKSFKSPVLVGTASLGQSLVLGFQALDEAEKRMSRDYKKPFERIPPPPPRKDPPVAGPSKHVKQMAEALGTMPTGVVGLTRKPDLLLLEIRQPGLRGATARVANVWVDWSLERMLNRGGPRFYVDEAVKEPLPEKLPEKKIEEKPK